MKPNCYYCFGENFQLIGDADVLRDVCKQIVKVVFLLGVVVSSGSLGQRSEQPRGPCEAQRSRKGSQCNTFAD